MVNIITKDPPQNPQLQAGLSYGSFGANTYHLIYGSGRRKLGYLFTASRSYSEGERENSWKRLFDVTGKLTYSSFIFSGGYSQAKRGLPGSLAFPTPDATQRDKKSRFSIAREWDWGKNSFSLKGFLHQDRIVYSNPTSWQGPVEDTTTNKTYGVNLNCTRPFLSIHNLTWGIDWGKDQVNVITVDGTSRIGGKKKATLGALYLQDEMDLSSDVTAVAGVRYDNHSVYGSQVSPRFSLLYHIGSSTTLRASWEKAFRPPTINDLYWQEDWGGGAGMFGNPELVPEKSSQWEIGAEKVFSSQFLGRLTFFSSHVEDKISWVQVSPLTWEAQNIDEAQITGLEGELKLSPWERMSASVNYTLLEAKDTKEFKGNLLPYRPGNKLSWVVNYKLQDNLQFYLEGRMVGERYTNRENTEKLPSYSLLGARVTFSPAKKTEFFLKVENLLDEEYQEMKGYPMPGRTIRAGVDMTL